MNISRKIKDLVDELNRNAYEYYTLDTPTISDSEYDKKYDELLVLEKETGVILPNSPTQRVGGEVLDGFEKIIHKNKLWSLDKAHSKDELKNWCENNDKFIREYNRTQKEKLPEIRYVVTKKYDGLTINCSYNNGDYQLGATRGTGEVGEDVTKQVSTMINLPKKLSFNNRISFHGEGLMTKKAFEEYNKEAKTPLKNLRNGVAGAIRNLNTSETAKRKCMMCFYNISDCDFEGHFETYGQQLDFMSLHVPTTEYRVCDTFEEVVNEIDEIEAERNNLQYDIDGVVVAIDDIKTRNILGYTAKFPRYAIAFKFKAQEVTTTLQDVIWRTGRTGKVTPTGLLSPVDLMGATVKRATLNNADDIKRKNVKIGGRVFIRRSNDVIPEIMGNADDNGTEIKIPTHCQSCGSLLIKDGVHLFCRNSSCKPQLVKSIAHYVSRTAMNIDGMSSATIEKFIEKGFIKSIVNLYTLEKHKDEIIKMDGFGLKSYNNLIKSIEKSKLCKLENFIFALGIDGVGLSTARNLVEFLLGNDSETKLENLTTINESELLKMNDCGEVTAYNIAFWFYKNNDFLQDLICYISFIDDEESEVKGNKLEGLKIYCTGTFENYKKEELKKLVEENGGTFANGYAKSLDMLVIGSVKGSSKEQKAIKDGVKIVSEGSFIEMIKED